MEIVFQTIRIIDYENNVVYVRDTPETFSDYVRTLITYINDNSSINDGNRYIQIKTDNDLTFRRFSNK